MRVAVLGGSGTIGALVSEHLWAAGHEAVPASRRTGVDAAAGRRLDFALSGADAVVDALNVDTLRTRRAVTFFATAARNVAHAARRAGVGQIVCVSIAGATDPQVHRGYGYYRAKSAQEQAYRSSGMPVTLIHSTQWFELIPGIAASTSVGPVTVMPTMRMAAVAADSVARLVSAEAVREPPARVREVAIRGPEVATGAEIARTILAGHGTLAGRRPRVLTEVPFFGRAIATGGLIPEEARVDDVTLREWL